MSNMTIQKRKKHLIYKIKESLNLIAVGNQTIQDSLETLGPTLTTTELQTIYDNNIVIMDKQIIAYTTLTSEGGKPDEN